MHTTNVFSRIAEHFGLRVNRWCNSSKISNLSSERVKLAEMKLDRNQHFRVRIIKGEMADVVDGLIVDTTPKSGAEAEGLFLLSSGDALNMIGGEQDTSGPETGSVEIASGQYTSFVDLIEAIGDALKEVKVSNTHSLRDLVNLHYSPSRNKMHLYVKQMDQAEFLF